MRSPTLVPTFRTHRRSRLAGTVAARWLSLFVCIGCVISVPLKAVNEVSLSWTDNSNNELGFEVERMALGNSFEAIAIVEQSVVQFTDIEVTPGMEYQYRVRAFNDFGYSGYTNVVTETLNNTAPQILSLAGEALEDVYELNFQRGDGTGEITIEIADAETLVEELVFELTPFNAEVVPFESIDYSIEGNLVTLSIDTLLMRVGTSDVSFIVSDGVEAAEAVLSLTVNPNIAPRVSSLGSYDLYDGQVLEPRSFTIIDDDTPAENLVVTVFSSNEDIVPNSSISLSRDGYEGVVSVSVPEGVSGSVLINIHVDDGYNQKIAPLSLNVTQNNAPQISGLASSYEIPAGGRISDIPFSVFDSDHGTSNLEITFSANNSLLFPPALSKIRGTGSSRTLNIVPSKWEHGSTTLYVTVSDGIKSTRSDPIQVTVLPPAVSVKVISFRVKNGLPVAEVESRPGAIFTLQRTYSLVANIWETVENTEIVVDGSSTFLVDPTMVDEPVCYRVFASE